MCPVLSYPCIVADGGTVEQSDHTERSQGVAIPYSEGHKGHKLTAEDRRQGGIAKGRAKREMKQRAMQEFAERITGMDMDALQLLHDQVTDPSTDEAVRQRAAMYLIDRLHGKPLQKSEQDISINEELETAKATARDKLTFLLKDTG